MRTSPVGQIFLTGASTRAYTSFYLFIYPNQVQDYRRRLVNLGAYVDVDMADVFDGVKHLPNSKDER